MTTLAEAIQQNAPYGSKVAGSVEIETSKMIQKM